MLENTTTIEDLHPEVLTRAIRLLDGPSLAAAACASTHLRSLASQSDLWINLCLSIWPSFRHARILPLVTASPRDFFAAAFPLPSNIDPFATGEEDLPKSLVSAVDIHHRGIPIFSQVMETETSTPWFHSTPFRIDCRDGKVQKLSESAAAVSPEELTMSWILIDPAKGQAVSVCSRKVVSIERHWYTGEKVARFAIVAEGGPEESGWVLDALVTCGEAADQAREVLLTVNDLDGTCLSGRDGLRLVKAAMESRRKWRSGAEEEMKHRYSKYLRTKKRRKESRERREGMIDLCCTVVGVGIFVAFVFLLFFL
ncbi:hypothetical protein HPP92_009655 [Vanilla planifolia]|uniref:F-box protein n=1 Tax=Vanilla planifolia TaxID=51239 RepID=A0A835RG80_VANPL|nr:hypothetical protein HPP92_009655 [Vanilla planifolia]